MKDKIKKLFRDEISEYSSTQVHQVSALLRMEKKLLEQLLSEQTEPNDGVSG